MNREHSVLVGRRDQLERLGASLLRALDDEGGVVLVHGEAGVGKTALVQAAVGDLPDGVTVLTGACDPLATPRPLGPLHDIAPDLGAEPRDALATGAAPHVIFAATYEQLRSIPHVLVVEDAHWADEATLDLLRYLGRRIAGTRSSLVVTYRDTEVDDRHPLRAVLGEVVRSARTARVEVGGLSLDAVEELVAGTGLVATDVHALTAGNAFFVTEVAAQPGEPVPDNVRDAVLGRTSQLDDTTLAALRRLACIPSPVGPEGLAALEVTPATVETLVVSGLVARDGPRLRFRHELGRRTVFDALPATDRTMLHRRLLDRLRDTAGASAALLAHLARHAGCAEDVVHFARRAADEAARAGAHREAAAFLEAGVEACPEADRATLLESLSYERYHVDRIAEAIAAAEEALELRRADGEVVAVGADLRWLSRLHWFAGDRPAAERRAGEAVEVLSGAGDERELGFAFGQQATLDMTRGDPVAARRWGEQAADIADRLGLPELEAQMLSTVGMADIIAGDHRGAASVWESVTRAEQLGLDEHCARALTMLAYVLVDARMYDEATQVLERGLDFAGARDLDTFLLHFRGLRARLRLARGHWTAAWDDATQVLSAGSGPLNAMWPLLVRGLLRLRRDDPDSREPLDEAWAMASGFGEDYRMVPVAVALAEHDWLTGGSTAGDRLSELATALPPGRSPWVARELGTWLRRLELPVPDRLHDLGLPAADGEAGLRESATAWSRLGTPYEHALALIDVGTADALLEAHRLLDGLGATRTLGATRRRLRRLGVAIPLGPRRSTRANPAGLTARQIDVVRLLADGLTNGEIARRLYISEKTAGHHVSAILTKLGVPDRRQAAAVATELGLTG